MYRIEYRSEGHLEFGYSHCYTVKGKAWAEENLSPDGFVTVRPTTYENIYYSLRYLYDQPDTDWRNRAQRRHG